MHKVHWCSPVILYGVDGDHFEARGTTDQHIVRSMPTSMSASRVRDLAECNLQFQRKLLDCAFMSLEGGASYSANGVVESWDHHGAPSPLCSEQDHIYVNLCTHLTCYGDGGRLDHAEQVHCTTVCMPRRFPVASTDKVVGGMRAHWASAVKRACSSARVLIKQHSSFHYLHAADFSVLKIL